MLLNNTTNYNQIPDIITHGLVFYVDAQNLASYPGTGTAIYNVAGQPGAINVTGSMVNGATWQPQGYWQFDGIDDHCRWANTNFNFRTGNATYMGTSRYITLTTNGRTFSGGGNTGSPGAEYVNWILGHWNNTTENYYAANTIFGIPGGPNDTRWRVYAGTQNTTADTWGFWVNGRLIAQNNGGTTGIEGLNWCRYTGASPEASDAQIINFLIYNRVLTTEEILYNTQALTAKIPTQY